jgi:hemolysin activation/secretion protein
VIEGYISDAVLRGEVGGVAPLIDRHLASIRAERPINIATLERHLLLINDLPGITALGVLRPGRSGPGSAQLLIRVRRKRFEASLAGDNRGSRFTGPAAASLTLASNAATALGERIEATAFSTAQIAEQQFYDLSGQVRFGSDGMLGRANVSASPAQPGFTLEPLQIQSIAYRGRASLEYPILRSRRMNVLVGGGLDITSTELTGASAGFNASDQLTVVWTRAGFDFRDSLASFTTIDGIIRRGLPVFGASPNDDPTPSRAEGRSDFTLFQIEASRLQRLFSGLNLEFKGALQWSLTPLLADEEFALGGAGFGRAFDPAEFSGDSGFGGSVELQIEPAALFNFSTGFVSFLQIYGFADYGRIKNLLAVVNQREEVVSAGAGMRINVRDWLSLGFEVGRPINRSIAVES